jgi:chitodextrinase
MLGAAPTQAPSSNAVAVDSSSSVAWAPRRSARWLATASIAALALVLLPAWAGAARPQARASVLAARTAAHGAKSRALPRLWVVQVSRGADGWFNRATLKRVRKEGIDALALRISALGRKPAGEKTFGSVRRFASAEKLYLVAVLPAGKLNSGTPAARAALAACSGRRDARLRCAVQASSVTAAARLARQHNSVLQLVALYVKGPRRLSKLARLPKSLRRRILVIAPLHGSVSNTSAWGTAIGQTAASPSLYMGVAPHTRKATPGVQEFAALLAGGSSSAAGVPPDTEPPSAPTGLVTSAVGQTSMTLSWDASSDNVGVAGYRLFVNVSQVGTSRSTSYSFTGLSCGTSYKLGIVAYDAAGNVSGASTLSQSTTACSGSDGQPPSTPAGLSTSSVGQTSMTLSWNPSTDNVGVTGYRLFLNGSQVGTSSSTSHSFTGLSCGTSYTLGVAAYDAAGNVSGTATVAHATSACSDTQPPSTPAGLVTSSVGQMSMTLSWNASTDNVGVAGYRLFLNGSEVGTSPSASYSFTGLTCGTSYTLGVAAYDAAGNVSETATTAQDSAACGSSSATANLWVSSTGSSSCTRSAAPVSYSSGGPSDCSSFDAAYLAAAQGDLVLVKDGSYGAQAFTSKTTTGWTQPVAFEPEDALGATIETQSSSAATISIGGQSWITIDGFNINGYQRQCPADQQSVYPGCGNSYEVVGDSTAGTDSHITFENNDIDVGKLNGGGSMFFLFKPQNWQITGNTFGPSCCGADSVDSPVAITIGKPSNGTNDCSHEGCNVEIDHNLLQYADLRHASDWPSSGWGTVPEPSCTDTTHCHLDGIHIGGLIGGQIDFNQFLGDDCEGVYMEGGGYQGNDNRDIDIIGNTWTAFSDHCNGGVYVKCSGTSTCGGTWNIGFNSGNDVMTLGTGWAGAETGTVVNIYGNYTYLNMVNASGNNAGCMAGTIGNVTVNYQYNVWRGPFGSGGNTTGPCDSTDTDATTPGWVDASGAPNTGLDVHLAGASGTAIDYVPCASLTIGSCPTGIDVFGNAWPSGAANAGADQTGAG